MFSDCVDFLFAILKRFFDFIFAYPLDGGLTLGGFFVAVFVISYLLSLIFETTYTYTEISQVRAQEEAAAARREADRLDRQSKYEAEKLARQSKYEAEKAAREKAREDERKHRDSYEYYKEQRARRESYFNRYNGEKKNNK